MNAKGLILNDIRGLRHVADARKDSMYTSLITRTWKEEKLTEQLIRREYRLAKEEKIRASKGVIYGGLLGAMLWCTIVIGVYILF